MRPFPARNSLLLAAFTLLALASAGAASEWTHHQLRVEFDPDAHTLTVIDRVRLAEGMDRFELLLNAALKVRSSEPPLTRVPLGDVESFFGINGGGEVELARYRLESAPVAGELTVEYGGRFDFGLSDPKEEYTRGFRETAGIVGDDGVYLAGSSFWVPTFGNDLVTFELEVSAPADWHLISQGDGESSGGRARWATQAPMDEIYLVGGPLLRYADSAGAVETLVFLRQDDPGLAAKYLDTTALYLELYRGLLGPYPYSKFALVENFWETGYGMPSFTLLGPRVIRFPFILHSSYPHEILHNWWGNSVFVDYDSGNWCEGLTAYLADHLVKEQRGQGAEYRRGVLQKYRDFVREGRDFPLREFRSRHSAATEAVGYGKTLMGFHMLRLRLSDEVFVRALQRFYRRHQGQRASFADLQKSLEEASEQELAGFFADWTERPGAAALTVAVDEIRERDAQEHDTGFGVEGRLEQTQSGAPIALEVPVVIATTAGPVREIVPLAASSARFSIATPSRPLGLAVDPEFDVFRLLDPRETPPSIGQIFGQEVILAVLPSAAGEASMAGYRQLLDAWQSDSHRIRAVLDTELEGLPAESAAWILGRENRFAELFEPERAGIPVDKDTRGLTIQGEEIPFEDHSLVVVRRHPENLEAATGWLVVEPAEAFAGMARKLPHYGKYSYLGFAGTEPTNTVKGQWPAADSPLTVDLRPEDERGTPLDFSGEKRQALAEMPEVFSQKAFAEHVDWLAAPERQGRGIGSRGLAEAGQYIAERFAALGLEPGGDDGSFFQTFRVAEGPDGQAHEARNVIGILPGSRDDWRGQSALLTAHYDHLGMGWPDVHQGDAGKIHPGADDNASGVAVLLELAKNLAGGEKPSRSVLFIAFSAEEAGRLGSRHYAENPRFPVDQILGVINLDTVGRLGDGKVSVLGTGTASEWQHIFRGASFVTGVESRNIPGSAEGSDQWSFIEQGVPGVQIFTQAHGDIHRPGDTADKVDPAGLVRVATLVKEAIVYLGERADPMTVTIPDQESAPPPRGTAGSRRVSFGSVPDFAFAGPGVRLSDVTSGSPAQAAGLEPGDVLLSIDGAEIADLRAFSELLKTLQAGQTVRATVRRGDQVLEIPVTVTAR